MKALNLVDYHIHTARCGHAEGEMEEYAARALDLGLKEIGFSDHFPLLHMEDETLSMGLEEMPLYIWEVGELRAEFPHLPVRLGIEVDYLPETAARLPSLLSAYPFDYIMGSLHFVDGWGFDDPRNLDGYVGCDLLALWTRYFELLGDAAESGIFDVLAHPDLIKKFAFRPDADVSRIYRDCVDRVAATGVAIEVSTAGLRKPVGEIYPGESFLRLCFERGIAVTLGSDAHRPGEVGERFAEALLLLRRIGYGEVAVFDARRRSYLELPV
ncbi:MAG: histidinol-phosphatase HisJ family protein [Actinobacteria bacterium]|jgi:histidinol-phosphatase (PHP family)|nr:MAG: histidinol-phosphatase HisJ family protein [Actinomycetota bacterium]